MKVPLGEGGSVMITGGVGEKCSASSSSGRGGFLFVDAGDLSASDEFNHTLLPLSLTLLYLQGNSAKEGANVFISCNDISTQVSRSQFSLTLAESGLTKTIAGISLSNQAVVDLSTTLSQSSTQTKNPSLLYVTIIVAVIAFILAVVLIVFCLYALCCLHRLSTENNTPSHSNEMITYPSSTDLSGTYDSTIKQSQQYFSTANKSFSFSSNPSSGTLRVIPCCRPYTPTQTSTTTTTLSSLIHNHSSSSSSSDTSTTLCSLTALTQSLSHILPFDDNIHLLNALPSLTPSSILLTNPQPPPSQLLRGKGVFLSLESPTPEQKEESLRYLPPEISDLKSNNVYQSMSRVEREHSIAFTLGLFLFESLTHTAPFHMEDAERAHRKIMKNNLPPMQDITNRSLSKLLNRMLASTPHSRPSLSEIVDALASLPSEEDESSDMVASESVRKTSASANDDSDADDDDDMSSSYL